MFLFVFCNETQIFANILYCPELVWYRLVGMDIGEIPGGAPSSSDFSSSIFGTAGVSEESSFKIFLKENKDSFIYLKFHIHEKLSHWLLSVSFAVTYNLPLKPAKTKPKVLTGMKAFLKVFPYVFENQLSLLILQTHLQSMLPVIAKFLKFITSLKKK